MAVVAAAAAAAAAVRVVEKVSDERWVVTARRLM